MADDTDDVLDNWEDEDAEVLERRMEERQKQQKKEKKKQPLSKTSTSTKNQGETPATPLEVQTHLPLRTQEAGRTEYVAPIKILKRQADTKGTSSATQTSTMSSVQRKSLAEREADYASARARILGSGYGSSADDASASPTVTTKSTSSRGPGDGPGESIKRQPNGPNGTKGFRAKAKS